MPSDKAREAWINAYNEWVNFARKTADDAAAAEIDAAVLELVEAAEWAANGVHAMPECTHGEEADYCDGCRYAYEQRMAEAHTKLRTALKGWTK